jgi:hypothetical protein
VLLNLPVLLDQNERQKRWIPGAEEDVTVCAISFEIKCTDTHLDLVSQIPFFLTLLYFDASN